MTTISIRQATVSDAEDIATLLGQLGHPGEIDFIKKQIMKFRANDNGVVWVAVSSQQVVGFLVLLIYSTFHHQKPVARLLDLCVLESHRRAHIGELLVEEAVSLAKKKSCSKLEVSCQNFRKDAHKFYDRMGFEQTHHYFAKSV
jgi:ribosomal protein S18 acetylase RimI-like enzyme